MTRITHDHRLMHRNVSWKAPCRAATTANITISTALNNGDALDGVTLATGDRVLVKNQSTGSQNGIYVVGVTPVRADDWVAEGDVLGAVVVVTEGTAGADTAWLCTTNAPITVATTALVFAAFGVSSGGSLTVEEVDGSPTDSAVTKIVFPNGTLSITAHVVTYTPAGGGGGTVMSAKGHNTSADVITSFSEEKVPIGDSTEWDDWGTMVSGDDFVVPTGQAGKFRVLGNCELIKHGGASPTTGWVELSIRDSAGTTYYAKANVMYTALLLTQDEFALCSADLDLADADSVSLWVSNNMDRSVDLDNGGGPFCGSLAIEKLS